MKCRDCSNQALSNRSMCQKCLDRAKNKMKSLRDDAISKGLCYRCRKTNSIKNKDKCEECLKKDQIRHIKRTKKYLSENKCAKCAHPKSLVKIWTNLWCAGCHLKFKFKYNCTKKQAEDIINNLLQSQNYQCALTGRSLYNNKFHIDHIVPRSKGGKDEPDNWQLIVEEANIFKTDVSMEEIIKLARDITNHFYKEPSNG